MKRLCSYRLILIFPLLLATCPVIAASTTGSLLDLTEWKRYRSSVKHPALGVKPADSDRARANVMQHDWARKYAGGLEREARQYADRLTREFLVRMIPDTTPISTIFTPCPACRKQKKPYLPHGTWKWVPERSEQLLCTVCNTVYPNAAYPETVQLQSTWGRPQTFSFYGGDTFQVFDWKNGRPSFSGNIRSQKVTFMSMLVGRMASAYTLTGKPVYADACRKILLRFAEAYPHYLVHSAYGEIADLDPRAAAFSMQKLPAPELTYPPNQPDRTLFKIFWVAGRAAGSGIEGTLLRKWAEAYDLTCDALAANGSAIYSPHDRERIERDLLLEATILAVADPELNNKSIANRSAAGLVGMCVGHPTLMRYGLAGFRETVDEWFLPDGGTPESISYGFMAITGVRDLSLALRDYSDPPGYRGADGTRLDHFNLFRESNYPRIFQAFVSCLQPDLSFPPFADSREITRFPAVDAEILASVYPEVSTYSNLLAGLSGTDGAPADPATAIYLRHPDFQTSGATPVSLTDSCLPDLRIGFMRSGTEGRESLLLLNASHWGVHHHIDSLNLYYWKSGHELLTDFGYLWDHPEKQMTRRTLAHNLVMIDGKEQETRNRGGDVELFYAGERAKVMRASSMAYADAKTYRRTAALIDHGNGRSYAVDLFEVEGGNTQDFVYHGPTPSSTVGGITLSGYTSPIYDLSQVRAGTAAATWNIQWKMDNKMTFTAWNIPQTGETVFLGNGWGQRDSKNRDRGTSVPYVIRRCEGDGPRQFLSIFEGSPPGTAFVKNVKRVPVQGASHPGGAVALEVQTTAGTDYIAWNVADTSSTLAGGTVTLPQARFAVVSMRNGQPDWREAAR